MFEAENRPATWAGYNQDSINGIVARFCDPPFHCAVYFVPNTEGTIFPIVKVPGGHRVPVRARRSGPDGNIVRQNDIYVRKPGPRSEVPRSAQEWDDLLSRCQENRRDEMLAYITGLLTGHIPRGQAQDVEERLDQWIQTCFDRWSALIAPLPADVGPRFPHGYYNFAYGITGEIRERTLGELPAVLRRSVVRHTGWPPFWYPTREGIEPYPVDGAVECWLGGDARTPPERRDAAHADFWRISPEGCAYLLRGHQEDSGDLDRAGRRTVAPGTVFDITLPVWRAGETLLQAERLSQNLFEGRSTIRFVAIYTGLDGRSLASVANRNRLLGRAYVSREESISVQTCVESSAIGANLPEIVHHLLTPLYALFGFFELPTQLVADELARMRANNF